MYKLKDMDLSNVDILVSTINGSIDVHSDKRIPVIYISPFLNFKDTQILSDYGIVRRKNKPNIDASQLINIIKNNCVIIDEDKLTSELNNFCLLYTSRIWLMNIFRDNTIKEPIVPCSV